LVSLGLSKKQTHVRPLAKGELVLPGQRQRNFPVIAGGVGLSVSQTHTLEQSWRAQGVIPQFMQGLRFESYACEVGGQDLRTAQAWKQQIQQGQISAVKGGFVVADHESDRQLSLYRDPMGERTLFYTRIGAGLIYASNLDLLLASGMVQRSLNLDALARYLSYAYLPGRETLLNDVFELLPGEALHWSQGEVKTEHFWTLPEIDRECSEETAIRLLREELESAILRRMPAQETVCASLSGGIDSSLVVALLSKFSLSKVRTWSVSFGEKYRNELPFSQALAEAAQTEHQILEIMPQTVMHFLDATLACLGNPIGDPLTVPNALLFRTANAYGPVLFNGEGGDPLFGGPKNIPMLLSALYLQETKTPEFELARTYLHSYRKLYADLPQLFEPETLKALTPGGLEKDLIPWFSAQSEQSLVHQLMSANTRLKGSHHILYKVNAISQKLGVYPASPLFDKNIAELAFSMPPQFKLRGGVEKYILKQAVSDLLPAQILNRPKSGMQVPVEQWFKPGGPLNREAKHRLRNLAKYPWFKRDYFQRLAAWDLGGYLPRHGLKVWILLSLEAWLRYYIGGP